MYGHAIHEITDTYYSTFRLMGVQGIKLKNTDNLDPGFTKITLECAAILTQKTFDDYNRLNFEESPGWKIYNSMPKLFDPSGSTDDNMQFRTSVSYSLRSLQNFLSFMTAQKLTSADVPYLSLNSYKQFTNILHEAGKLLIDKARDLKQDKSFAGLEDLSRDGVIQLLNKQVEAQLSLLKDSYRKSDALANIADRNREILQNETIKQDDVINTLTTQMEDREREVNSQTETFSAAIKRREAEVYAEAAAAAVGAILSIFSGGFDPNKVYKTVQKAIRLAALLKKIVKVGDILKKLVDKLKNVGDTLRNLFAKIKNRLWDL